ncbi:hypothetical protein BJY04DRAFT_214216 [Aspergillus karnatakaensis]|uniref:uncharacterized protein n=1 Tax=Aspergillus karnatakaensis TaxID=1810916 RepID=UPI003CCE26EC
MKYFQVLLLLVLPFLAFAMPAPEAVEAFKNALVERQNGTGGDDILGGIGGLIGDLINSIGPLLELLNPETFRQIRTLLANGARLLNNDTTQHIINVVGGANRLLTPEFVDAVSGLIDAIAPLVNAIVQLISGILGAIFG